MQKKQKNSWILTTLKNVVIFMKLIAIKKSGIKNIKINHVILQEIIFGNTIKSDFSLFLFAPKLFFFHILNYEKQQKGNDKMVKAIRDYLIYDTCEFVLLKGRYYELISIDKKNRLAQVKSEMGITWVETNYLLIIK